MTMRDHSPVIRDSYSCLVKLYSSLLALNQCKELLDHLPAHFTTLTNYNNEMSLLSLSYTTAMIACSRYHHCSSASFHFPSFIIISNFNMSLILNTNKFQLKN